jgi:hypothetical protein
LLAAVVDQKKPTNQIVRTRRCDHRIRFGSSLNPRGDIRCITEGIGIVTCTRTDHHRARINPYARRQFRTSGIAI